MVLKELPKDHWEIIKGKAFTYVDYERFDETRWVQLLCFFEYFLKFDGEREVWFCIEDNILEKEIQSEAPESPLKEFFVRINKPMNSATPDSFRSKLNSLFLNSLTYLKKNPAVVGPQMKEIIERHKGKMGWCLAQYTTVETNVGEMVTRDTDTAEKKDANIPSLQKKMLNSLIKLADVYEDISSNIAVGAANKLPLQDKIKILKDLQFIFGAAGKKVMNNSFTVINMNGGVRDAERAMLDYLSKKE